VRRLVLLGVVTVATALVIAIGGDGTNNNGPVLLVVAFGALGVLVWQEMRRPQLRRRHVWAATVVLLAIGVVVPPESSRDLWSYAIYGRQVAVYHESPYTHVPAEHPHDPAVARINRSWIRTPSVYGPAFTAVSAVGMKVAGNSPLRMRLFFQLLAAGAVLAALAVLHRRGAPAGALALVGLSPLASASIVNNGHNDLLVGLGTLGAVLFARDRRGWAAGAVGALGCLVKVTGLLPLGAVVIWLWRRERLQAVHAAVAASLVMGIGYLLAGGTDALAPVRSASGHVSENSLWDAFVDTRTAANVRPSFAIWIAVFLVVAAVLVGWQRRPDPVAVTVAVGLAYLVAAPYVLPWYVGWILPVAALTWRSRLTRLTMGYAALAMIGYSIRPTMAPPVRAMLQQTRGNILPAVELIALVALVVVAWRRRQATDVLVPR
jgi:hypothetical protein